MTHVTLTIDAADLWLWANVVWLVGSYWGGLVVMRREMQPGPGPFDPPMPIQLAAAIWLFSPFWYPVYLTLTGLGRVLATGLPRPRSCRG